MKKEVLCFLLCIFLSGCTSQSYSNHTAAKSSQNIDSLRSFVDLPFKIDRVTWEVQSLINERGRVPGPNDYRLFADIVFNLSDSNSVKNFLKTMLNKSGKDVFLDSSSIRVWFSPDLKKIFYKEGGYIKVNGNVNKLDPEALQKTFFREGWIVKYDTASIFLNLSTM